MTNEQIDALLALEAKATPGPWSNSQYRHIRLCRKENAELISVMRNNIRELCEEVKRLRAAIDFLASLRSAYFRTPDTVHVWRLMETDVGAMRFLAEGKTPLEAVLKAMERK